MVTGGSLVCGGCLGQFVLRALSSSCRISESVISDPFTFLISSSVSSRTWSGGGGSGSSAFSRESCRYRSFQSLVGSVWRGELCGFWVVGLQSLVQ